MEIQAWATQQDWGSWADWFAALGTIAAVGVALGFGLRDGKRLKVERLEASQDRARFREQQDAEAEAQKRRLAARVSVSSQRFIDETGDRKCRWTVHNGGDESISRVAVVGRTIAVKGKETPPPFIFGIWTTIEAHGKREEETVPFGDGMVREAELQFTDGAGQFWQRKEYGTLKALDLDDPESIAGKQTHPYHA
ncbi:hypothetical protein [Arthrobacter sp. W4I7]|uniref:hypothetical protein n=1 Tax=Arthrobacter sp. W4I7 TaxID=3042296 RepID=UPI0027867C47|nr:hypothetical protein [Arthrobacter sp. W4I7]MDQ0691467.1 hypothetical protein [Arthrobacter sp. W4I7]